MNLHCFNRPTQPTICSQDLKNVIVQMFIDVLNLDGNTLGAWGKTVDFWYKHIFSALNAEETR